MCTSKSKYNNIIRLQKLWWLVLFHCCQLFCFFFYAQKKFLFLCNLNKLLTTSALC